MIFEASMEYLVDQYRVEHRRSHVNQCVALQDFVEVLRLNWYRTIGCHLLHIHEELLATIACHAEGVDYVC